MTKFFTYVLGMTLLGSIVTNCTTHNRLQSERLAHAQTKTEFSEQVAAAQQQRAEEEAKRRKAEQELRDAQEEHAQEVQALHLDVDRARAAGRVASERLRDAATAAAARARAQCAAATPADLRAATGDPVGVLADVLGRADERAGLLADLADRRYLAGRACEREYDAAREKLKGLQ